MKKILLILLVLSMLLPASAAFAEGMGVQVIGGPETETEPVSLDDLKLNVEAEIEGYGTITLTSFAFKDYLGHYTDEKTIYKWDWEKNYYESGNEADYALLYLDILNTTTAEKDYLNEYTVTSLIRCL